MIRSLVVIGSVAAFIAAGFQGAEALDIRGTLLSTSENRAAMETLGTLAARPEVKQVAKKVVKTAVKQSAKVAASVLTTKNITTAWTALKGKIEDPAVLDVLGRIEWAAGKADIRLCQDLVIKPGVSPGDAVALCIARVTGNADHCLQIDAVRSPMLSKMCREALATEA